MIHVALFLYVLSFVLIVAAIACLFLRLVVPMVILCVCSAVCFFGALVYDELETTRPYIELQSRRIL